jgi:propionate catabolism operon transcriptional regulator
MRYFFTYESIMPRFHPYRFAVVSHTPRLEAIMKETLRDHEITLDYFDFSYENPLSMVQNLLDQGYEVVICYSSLGASLLYELGRSVVVIPRDDYEIIKAIAAAKKVASNITLTLCETDNIDTQLIESLLNIKIKKVMFNSLETLSNALDNAINEGIEVLVGGGLSHAKAQRNDIPFFRIKPNSYSIEHALIQAKGMARDQRVERERLQQFIAMLKLFRVGVLCVNELGDTIFSNEKAQELLKFSHTGRNEASLGKYNEALMINEVLQRGEAVEDKSITINGEQLLITTLPFSLHPDQGGAITFISDVNSIHNIAGQLRKNRQKTGFIAHYQINNIIGETPEIKELKSAIKAYAPKNTAVWIKGETGTGKELIAQSLHNASLRAKHPFVAVNCAALTESLLESELFGYAEGAFTGAKKGGKPGFFEMAHQGTLFLDEIGDMGLETQARLLRVLETKEIVRVGGDKVIPVDIRVISASHKPLATLVKERTFRQDLFYRLTTLRLRISPLRKRPSDIPLLLDNLLKSYGKSAKSLTPSMLEALSSYSWPGNVRELFAFLESYLILLGNRTSNQTLFLKLLGDWISDEPSATTEDAGSSNKGLSSEQIVYTKNQSLKEQLECIRQQLVQRAVNECGGNKKMASSRLGISYNTLWRIMID